MTIKHTAGGTRYEQHGEPLDPLDKCQGGPTGPDFKRCDKVATMRMPYRSVFPGHRCCDDCAALWCNGRVPAHELLPDHLGMRWITHRFGVRPQ